MRIALALLGLIVVTSGCRGDSTPPSTAATEAPPAPTTEPSKGDEPAIDKLSWELPPVELLKASIAPGVGDSWAFVAWTEGQRAAICLGDLELCNKRLAAASTFKVPHAVIALETAVVTGADHAFKWDGKKRWLDAWNRDHTLASAIRFSTVWYFRRLAPMIGRDRMQNWLKTLEVGNQTIGSELDRFWLDGSLKISALEQARFWHRLVARDLPVSANTAASIMTMTALEDLSIGGKAHSLHGKTGWFRIKGKGQVDVGWFVGCVLTEKRVCFASVIEATEPFDHKRFIAARRKLAIAGLRALASPAEPSN